MLKHGYSQSELARLVQTRQSTIQGWLTGAMPRRRTLSDLSQLFNVSEEWLETGNDTGKVKEDSVNFVARASTSSPDRPTLRLETNDDYKALVETFIGEASDEDLLKIIDSMGKRMVSGDKAAIDQARVLIDMIHAHRPETFSPNTELPYYGCVAAGKPSDVDYHSGETMTVPGSYRRRPHYILRVRGRSMEPNYPDGSYVVVRALETGEYARKGDIVIAHDGDGACIKKLEYRVSGQKTDVPRKPTPHLVSINPDFDEIIPIGDTPIQGIVVDQYDADFFNP